MGLGSLGIPQKHSENSRSDIKLKLKETGKSNVEFACVPSGRFLFEISHI